MRGRAYRRSMRKTKDIRLRKIIKGRRYTLYAGYIPFDWVDGVWVPTYGDYIRYPKN